MFRLYSRRPNQESSSCSTWEKLFWRKNYFKKYLDYIKDVFIFSPQLFVLSKNYLILCVVSVPEIQ